MKYDSLEKLQNGGTVAVIGGGPAGASCAIALKNLAREKGIGINVVLYEGKNFSVGKQYNQCAGVLSPPIDKILEDYLDVPFPRKLVQRTIDGYMLHGARNEVDLVREGEVSYALRRITFDDYLLNQVVMRGVKVVSARVTELEFYSDCVRVYSEGDHLRADVVVGAFGCDDGTTQVFSKQTSYRPPSLIYSIVTNVHPGDEHMQSFGNRIHAFLPGVSKIEFGAITPKRNHLTINIAGKHVDARMMQTFLSLKPLRELLPPEFPTYQDKLNIFKGKFPSGKASGIYGDRYITIGDATGLLRPFKGKGVNTGVITGYYAARVIIEHGISAAAFQKFREYCAGYFDDMNYGKVFRILAIIGTKLRMLDNIMELAKSESVINNLLFDAVSAHRSYHDILNYVGNPRTIFKLTSAGLGGVFKRNYHINPSQPRT
ncbi:MAG: hypothetical protein CO189_03620 [candidate division Zixibacteria bacterium CG_4_9_14_3_um_filter_46_8]|nr:MAG: hypothetical protein CO189_03620 [candidate division Zixibacteria bacterium CG_4_9_14_3_um_filter_46_8]